jgi:hypothetical protein
MKFGSGHRLSRAKKALTIAVAIIGGTTHVAFAQSCAMCYQNAAASGARGKVALQHGILILALPAISIFGALLFLLYSRRNVNASVMDRSDLETLHDEGRQLRQVNTKFVAAK